MFSSLRRSLYKTRRLVRTCGVYLIFFFLSGDRPEFRRNAGLINSTIQYKNIGQNITG